MNEYFQCENVECSIKIYKLSRPCVQICCHAIDSTKITKLPAIIEVGEFIKSELTKLTKTFNIVFLKLIGNAINDHIISICNEFNIKYISLHNTQAGIIRYVHKDLNSLSISSTKPIELTEEDWQAITDQSFLETLSLRGIKISDNFAINAKLTFLSLCDIELSNFVCKLISGIFYLRQLELVNVNIQDRDFELICKLFTLKELTLSNTTIKEFSPIKNLHKLEELSVISQTINNKDLQYITASIKTLYLNSLNITSLEYLPCSNLEQLNIYNTMVTAQKLYEFLLVKTNENLRLITYNNTDSGYEPMLNMDRNSALKILESILRIPKYYMSIPNIMPRSTKIDEVEIEGVNSKNNNRFHSYI